MVRRIMKMDLNTLSNVPFHWPWHIDKGEKMVRNEEGGRYICIMYKIYDHSRNDSRQKWFQYHIDYLINILWCYLPLTVLVHFSCSILCSLTTDISHLYMYFGNVVLLLYCNGMGLYIFICLTMLDLIKPVTSVKD